MAGRGRPAPARYLPRRRSSDTSWRAGWERWWFLPGFLLVAANAPLVPRLRKSAAAVAALDGVVAGSLALMAVVVIQLGKASIVDRTTLVVFGLSLVALLRLRANSAWIVAGAAAVGWLIR